MNIKSKVLIVLCLCLAPAFSSAQAGAFGTNLSLGTKGEDVRALQKLLNLDKDTLVADTGAGSLGNETDYFGPATKRALIKFQNKYASEILFPLGMSTGNGYFGARTREKANSLTANLTTLINSTIGLFTSPIVETPVTLVTATTSTKSEVKLPVEKGTVIVMMPSRYSGKPGTTITLSGAGFTSTDNTVYFGTNHALAGVTSFNGQSVTFKVPAIPKGIYSSLYVVNARGESNKDQWFIVTDGVSPEPKIEKFEPGIVSRGSTVVIKGAGFSKDKNAIIVSGIGLFKNVPSVDGASISLVIPKDAFPVKYSPTIANPTFSSSVRVLNENGVSNLGKLTLSL
ncbi:MAG: IPT/TIG domain-containing protein [Candidatus Paceibacterota bacterium]|jgi:hypothetical protein